jgi:hypothetical protein
MTIEKCGNVSYNCINNKGTTKKVENQGGKCYEKRNMFKGAMVMALVAGMAVGMAMTSFAATGQWKKNDTGW